MISMATERSVFQTICAITTMAVATQRYVKVFFILGQSNDFFLKLIFTVLLTLYSICRFNHLYSLYQKNFTKGDHMIKTNQLQF